MLELLNIPRSMLPEVRNSSEVYGQTNIGGKGGVRIPVAGIAGDQQAALYGHLCTRAGQAKKYLWYRLLLCCFTPVIKPLPLKMAY